jgi:hypothetical protein
MMLTLNTVFTMALQFPHFLIFFDCLELVALALCTESRRAMCVNIMEICMQFAFTTLYLVDPLRQFPV